MVIRHKHHLKPKHLGGTDDPSNLIKVSVYDHATIHLAHWIAYGRWQDRIAWEGLSGLISNAEAIAEVNRQASSERISKTNKRRLANGTHNLLGPKHNTKLMAAGNHPSQQPKTIEKMKHKAIERVFHGNNHFVGGAIVKKQLRDGTHHSQKYYTCPHCKKTGRGSSMFRNHFDKCKDRIEL